MCDFDSHMLTILSRQLRSSCALDWVVVECQFETWRDWPAGLSRGHCQKVLKTLNAAVSLSESLHSLWFQSDRRREILYVVVDVVGPVWHLLTWLLLPLRPERSHPSQLKNAGRGSERANTGTH